MDCDCRHFCEGMQVQASGYEPEPVGHGQLAVDAAAMAEAAASRAVAVAAAGPLVATWQEQWP
jgi:hypothetical protein